MHGSMSVKFTYSSLHISFPILLSLSPDSTVTKPLIFLSLSCSWLVYGCPAPTDVVCHVGKDPIFESIVRNVVFLWLGKIWDFGVTNWILRDAGTGFFKAQKAGTNWIPTLDRLRHSCALNAAGLWHGTMNYIFLKVCLCEFFCDYYKCHLN